MKNKKLILEIDNLKKYFVNSGKVNKAVDGISFDVHEGEIVGLIGESGSGKTTVGRSLLRLYDNYNGFVRLDDKIISGKKISKQRQTFLRRNIQMIFQDPHASLNGQKNIYSTLKEPLLVNKIIKEKIKDIFSDWSKVTKTFEYTFKIKTKNLEIENLNSFNKDAKVFVAKWTKIFENLSFDMSENLDDNFNKYFAYLEEKQSIESEVINQMYSNTTDLIAYFEKKQQDFRNNVLDQDEAEVNLKTKNYEEALLKSKNSQAQIEARKDLANVSTELKDILSKYKDFKIINKNTFNNYIFEFKNEIRIQTNSRLMATNLDYYIYNLKRELLNKKIISTIRRNYVKLNHLDFDSIKEFIKEIKSYAIDFYNKQLQMSFDPKAKRVIKDIIHFEFNFILDKYIQKSAENKKAIKDEIKKLRARKQADLDVIHDKTQQPCAKNEELQQAKSELDIAVENSHIELNKFIENNKQTIQELDKEIVEINKTYYDLRAKIKNLTQKFMEINKQFIDFIPEYKQQNSVHKNEPKKIKKDIGYEVSSYNSIVSNKLETQKSFDIEYKYLVKDVHDIDLLLGIRKTWVDKILKDKYKPVKQFYKKVLSIPYIKYRISNLLYKTNIYKALEDVGLLKQFAYRYPHEFSGGQRQRIVIARALITQPKVIVADEPIASLDISIQAQVVNLLKELCKQKNIGLIFIAHDLSMIEYIADRVQIMHLGKIVECGNTEVIYKSPVHPYTINLFKAIPKISNADEKFQNISFELDYLKAQKFPFIPKMYLVEDDHWVFGTYQQVHDWTKDNKDIKTLKVTENDRLSFDEISSNKDFDIEKVARYYETIKKATGYGLNVIVNHYKDNDIEYFEIKPFYYLKCANKLPKTQQFDSLPKGSIVIRNILKSKQATVINTNDWSVQKVTVTDAK